MRVDLSGLFQNLSGALEAGSLSDRDVGDLFTRIMRNLVGFDHVVVFAYRGRERPVDLFSTFTPRDYEVFVSLYQAGPYLLDPFYNTARQARRGVWRMRELAPDRFFSSEYFRTYYVQTGLAEEVGFFVPLPGNVTVVLSLMRRETSGVFSTSDFNLIRQVDPLIAALVRRYWGDLEKRLSDLPAPAEVKGVPEALVTAENVWHRLGLTDRESAIVDLVLQGHSSESIGLRLEIATGTVKVHRRNVYRKLGIYSQIQLLSIYLKNVSRNSE